MRSWKKGTAVLCQSRRFKLVYCSQRGICFSVCISISLSFHQFSCFWEIILFIGSPKKVMCKFLRSLSAKKMPWYLQYYVRRVYCWRFSLPQKNLHLSRTMDWTHSFTNLHQTSLIFWARVPVSQVEVFCFRCGNRVHFQVSLIKTPLYPVRLFWVRRRRMFCCIDGIYSGNPGTKMKWPKTKPESQPKGTLETSVWKFF